MWRHRLSWILRSAPATAFREDLRPGNQDEERQHGQRVLLALGAVVALGACSNDTLSEDTPSEDTFAAALPTVPPQSGPTMRRRPSPCMGHGRSRHDANVVGMDLQAAQDGIQAVTELWLSESRDATGEGRMQIVDRNWVVVGRAVPRCGRIARRRRRANARRGQGGRKLMRRAIITIVADPPN